VILEAPILLEESKLVKALPGVWDEEIQGLIGEKAIKTLLCEASRGEGRLKSSA
jgi:hypothetical protein